MSSSQTPPSRARHAGGVTATGGDAAMTGTPPDDASDLDPWGYLRESPDDELGADARRPRRARWSAAPRISRMDAWWGRMLGNPGRFRLWYWGGPAAVTLLAALLRLINLGFPHALVFDETFYVKDAWTLSHLGYEGSWPSDADTKFNAGNASTWTSAPEFVAHPPMGKWLIAIGEWTFGIDNAFGWRVMTALAGIAAVWLIAVITRKLTGSTLIGVIAGFLMAIDGSAIVMSRVALLDNFVMFFALAAFGCILLDREWHARRLATRVAAARLDGRRVEWGPVIWWRPWLIAAGILLGLDSGVKWSGIYFLGFLACYTVVVDMVARRRNGMTFWASGALLKQAPATFVLMVPIAAATYLATWTGWLLTSGGYFRNWVTGGGGKPWAGDLAWVPHWFQDIWEYWSQMYGYSINLRTPHPYSANPFTWLFMVRPTSMYYQGYSRGQMGCTADQCSSAITDIANPLIYWAATAALVYVLYRLIRYREWQLGLVLTGFAAGYLPWLLYFDRTVFQFYMIAFQPYMIMALAIAIGHALGSRTDDAATRVRSLRIVGTYLGLVIAVSVFFWPLWTGEVIPFWYWNAHIWFPSWR